jgi:hypothetical protein
LLPQLTDLIIPSEAGHFFFRAPFLWARRPAESRNPSSSATDYNGSINNSEEGEEEEKVTHQEQYAPGPASEAQVRKGGDKWTLILGRELGHSPEKVWQALTDPAELRE